jgi:N-acetylglutamate synthase-like GNAT family acetyltransferase
MKIVRIDEDFQRWDELLALILSSFAYMNDRIDPPSSALKLTPATLADKACAEIAYAAMQGDTLSGCIFLRPEEDCLYIGKLAIAPESQGRGVGRRLLAVAEQAAQDRGLASLRLETRIELVENHDIFSRWGFEKVAENAHPGFTRTTSIEMRKPVSA